MMMSAKKIGAFCVGKARKCCICPQIEFVPNSAISEFLYLVIGEGGKGGGGEGVKKSLTAKKGMMYGTFLLTP